MLVNNNTSKHTTERLEQAQRSGNADLSFCGFRDGDMSFNSVIEKLSKRSSWLELDASENSLGDLAAMCIAKAIRQSNSVKIVKLSSNAIGDEGITCIADSLVSGIQLQSLDVSANRFGSAGAAALARSLADTRCCLYKIRLGSNHGISSSALLSIISSLQDNKTCRNLDLSHSKMSHPEIRALTKMLKKNRTITALNLAHNRIGTGGALILGKTLQELGAQRKKGKSRWESLRSSGERGSMLSVVKAATAATRINKLDVSHNGIRDAGALSLLEGAARCSSLTWLALASNKIEALEQDMAQVFADHLETLGAMRRLQAVLGDGPIFVLDFRFNAIGSSKAIAMMQAASLDTDLLLDGNPGLGACPFSFEYSSSIHHVSMPSKHDAIEQPGFVPPQKLSTKHAGYVEGLKQTVEHARILNAQSNRILESATLLENDNAFFHHRQCAKNLTRAKYNYNRAKRLKVKSNLSMKFIGHSTRNSHDKRQRFKEVDHDNAIDEYYSGEIDAGTDSASNKSSRGSGSESESDSESESESDSDSSSR